MPSRTLTSHSAILVLRDLDACIVELVVGGQSIVDDLGQGLRRIEWVCAPSVAVTEFLTCPMRVSRVTSTPPRVVATSSSLVNNLWQLRQSGPRRAS